MIFLNKCGIGTYRITACAILAVDRANGGNKEQNLVGITVHKAGNGRMISFLERIDCQTWMIRF